MSPKNAVLIAERVAIAARDENPDLAQNLEAELDVGAGEGR